MLTLFHHSLPPWAAEYGGWKLEKTVDYFLEFTRSSFISSRVITFFAGLVIIICVSDNIITFSHESS